MLTYTVFTHSTQSRTVENNRATLTGDNSLIDGQSRASADKPAARRLRRPYSSRVAISDGAASGRWTGASCARESRKQAQQGLARLELCSRRRWWHKVQSRDGDGARMWMTDHSAADAWFRLRYFLASVSCTSLIFFRLSISDANYLVNGVVVIKQTPGYVAIPVWHSTMHRQICGSIGLTSR